MSMDVVARSVQLPACSQGAEHRRPYGDNVGSFRRRVCRVRSSERQHDSAIAFADAV